MNKYKNYMQDQWDKLKTTATRVITDKEEEEGETFEDNFVELEPHTYAKLKKLAVEHQTSVQSIVHYALEQYLAKPVAASASHITLEQRERNPLLCLDGITKTLN